MHKAEFLELLQIFSEDTSNEVLLRKIPHHNNLLLSIIQHNVMNFGTKDIVLEYFYFPQQKCPCFSSICNKHDNHNLFKWTMHDPLGRCIVMCNNISRFSISYEIARRHCWLSSTNPTNEKVHLNLSFLHLNFQTLTSTIPLRLILSILISTSSG